MINKQYLEKIIDEEFPDLKKTQFKLNDESMGLFTERSLIPFLIYQNTTDSKYRLIELYLQENSPSYHFLPFYIALGFYRKTVDTALSNINFISKRFPQGKHNVVVRGTIYSVVKLNYLNRSMILRSGTGFDMEIPFSEDFRLLWNYPNGVEIKNKLASFDKIVKASDHNIFSAPVPKYDKNHDGMILFTNITKFNTLLRNLKVSGNDLSEHLNIQKTIFDNRSSTISFNQLSSKKTLGSQVTVMVSKLDTVFAYDHILAAGDGKYDHLKTIIIDDFDLLLKSWERDGNTGENLKVLDELYFKRLSGDIKDVYLICRSKNFDVHSILLRYKINPLTWFLRPDEIRSLDNLKCIPPIQVEQFTEKAVDIYITKLEELIKKWRILGLEFICGGQTLAIVNWLYGIREKLNSFYSPNTLTSSISKVVLSLKNISTVWFSSGQDGGLISQTNLILFDILKGDFNVADNLAKKIQEVVDQGFRNLIIITNNTDLEDQGYIQSLLESQIINWRFLKVKEFLNDKVKYSQSNEKLIYLSWNKEIVNNMLTKVDLPPQMFLISIRGYQFVRYYSKRILQTINSLSSLSQKYDLLNLPPFEGIEDDVDLNKYVSFVVDSDEVFEEVQLEPLQEIEESIEDIVLANNYRVLSSESRERASVTVFFDDNSQLSFPENRSVFYYDEKSHDANLDQQKDAIKIVPGDLIIVPKNRLEINKLLDEFLSVNEEYARWILGDIEWRKKISDFINKGNGDMVHFRNKLEANGFKIGVDITIKKWIESDTIEPHNFAKLLGTLVRMNIIEDSHAETYLRGVKKLKRLKSQFVRTAIRKLIYSLKGIDYHSEETILDEVLLSRFLDHIEIKTVLFII